MNPDFSPSMLKVFLRIRVAHEATVSFPSPRMSAEKAAMTALRKQSSLSRDEFALAWDGKLKAGAVRTKIWAALWVDPAALGLRLVDGGGQEVIP